MTEVFWSDLICTGEDGQSLGTLGDMVIREDAALEDVDVDDATGAITSWAGVLISAPGEEPDWDTPRVPVNWAGFSPK